MDNQLVSVSGRPAEILLAEDNEDDVELTRLGFKRAKLLVRLHRVRDGEECLAFLRKQGQYVNAPTPDLILLDLNMPKISGREVLAELVRDEHLRSLPVVILTTSEQDDEVLKMYNMRCSSYIVKPVDFNQFVKVIRSIAEYWFTVVVLPKGAPAENPKVLAGA
ncbi:MAG TPA: response regulator [Bryobacteraceae bacterium]|nr:response regulator [Bryobacteraceae bacterium]